MMIVLRLTLAALDRVTSRLFGSDEATANARMALEQAAHAVRAVDHLERRLARLTPPAVSRAS